MTPEAALKARCNRAHARRRAAERHGLDLTDADLAAVEALIEGDSPDAVMLRPDHRRKDRAFYAVRRDGVWLPVVYDAATRSVITVLSPGDLDPYRHVVEPPPSPPPPEPEPPAARFRAPGDLLPNLPPVPGGPGRTVGQADEAIAALGRRIAAALGLVQSMTRSDPRRRDLIAEIERHQLLRKQWRAWKHKAHMRIDALAQGVPDPTREAEPADLLAAALAVMRQMAHRLGWEVTDRERAVVNAVQHYVKVHATLTSEDME